ncbi:hypothetical protein TWF225_008930 [Orbilia oligospora]|uniref:Uncharacterized protein n=1 Tax=Orbilia oligospora TaxID=2813651 RepID=A0A7C8K9D4_ORBOL|nr:hypothetical protein TWF751_009028 [Orbilia oligospora]KAF3175425.1 hypothetical protein TWF225_008930 [Orbilia oligospora]KAF3175426.1 hypothetical protein TWF225_008930 [Orbilia oligospora]KAF3264757.1 hypothetical protein TWF217_002943 [Orbilia oligospora]KAF3264758.1 hypothetical protein TWF217_002943 [Orbilia oligospora]
MACLNMLRGIYGTGLSLRSRRIRLSEYTFTRPLSSTTLLFKKQMPPRPKVDENDIEEKFLKGSGPGMVFPHDADYIEEQNKTSSAVQLRHIPTGIVVKSQETRSREQNRKIARQLLASKLEDIEKGEQSRNNVINEVKKKKKASKRKKSLRKYRKLEEVKAGTAGHITAGDDVTSAAAGELEAGEEDEPDESDDEDDDDGDDDGHDETSHGESDEEESRVTQEQGRKGGSSES